MTSNVIWPDIFDNLDAPYFPDIPEHDRKGVAIADQLSAWGLCMAGNKPPKTFGEGIIKLREFSGCLTAEEASSAAKKWHQDRS